jgi:sugar lactone lactonase YvrE
VSNAELFHDAKNSVGESPVWRSDEQRLYWVDIPNRQILSSGIDGTTLLWTLPEMVGCIAHIQANEWLAAMETGVFVVRLLPEGAVNVSPFARVNHAVEDMRFNDGRCDRQGRFLASTMFKEMSAAKRVGALRAFVADTSQRELASDLIVPNGLAFSPDGDTMYLSDSHPSVRRIWAFDYDVDAGTPSNQREFVDMNRYAGRPDGAAVDEDGCYWICGNDAGVVHRFTPAGVLDRTLTVPVKKPAMCAFGGPKFDTLFVTSIRLAGVDLSDQPLAGGVFALKPGVRGLQEPVFQSQTM